MSSKRNQDAALRNEIANRLDRLSDILVKQKIITDASPLRKGANDCRAYSTRGKWGYSVEKLIFRRLGKIKVFQDSFDIQNATLEFSVSVEGLCQNSVGQDPLTFLELNIDIFGSYKGKTNVEQAFSAWHLDRHNYLEPSEFMHPIYHLSFGGRHLESRIDKNDSSILLIDSPRIVHPPLEAVLGIDFVITNFLGNSISSFRQTDGTYCNIIISVQEIIWKPYINTLYGFWQPNSHTLPWSPKLIWPQLLTS